MNLVIQPFGHVPDEVLKQLAEDLSMFRADHDIREPRILPEEALDSSRGQYRAGEFLLVCSFVEGDKVLGVTSVDIFAEPLLFVFGQAAVGGKVAVISTARLVHEDGRLFRDRVFKEAVHELGHTFGLMHCSDRSCVMYFSNSLGDTDRKAKSYCPECAAAIPKDWRPKRR